MRIDPTNPVVAICVVGIMCVSACGHGPPERYASLDDYDTASGSHVTIALRGFDVMRPATGLSAFPDGGMAIGLDRGVEVNVCDKATGKFRQIAVLHEPQSNFDVTPMILEWLDTAVRISLNAGTKAVVQLPSDVRVGTPPKQIAQRVVIPECEKALNALRHSGRMPDGTSITPDSI